MGKMKWGNCKFLIVFVDGKQIIATHLFARHVCSENCLPPYTCLNIFCLPNIQPETRHTCVKVTELALEYIFKTQMNFY